MFDEACSRSSPVRYQFPRLPDDRARKSECSWNSDFVSGVSTHKSGVRYAYVCWIAAMVAFAKFPSVQVEPRA